MSLSWKLILSTVLIVAIAVSVCGYAVLSTSFRTELESQFDSAVQQSQLFCLSLGSLAVQALEVSFQLTPREALLDYLEEGTWFQTYPYRVLTEDGETLSAGSRYTAHLSRQEALEDQVQARLWEEDGRYVLETLQILEVDGQRFDVCLFHDLTAMFDARTRSLRTCQLASLGAIFLSAVVIVVLSMVLTAPIQKLSRTTRQMAGGQYDRRAKVHSHDELGQLAADFNRMADALERQISQLEDAAQRQRDFTASFAHELKTPLTSVIGYADTLRSRTLSREQQLRAANYIFSEGKRLEAMSFALLDLFALEKEAPVLRPVRARLVAAAAAESSRYLLRQKKQQLQADVEDARLLAEPSLLHTLLYNLLDNARKASGDGASIQLLGRRDGNQYVFQVRDHGRGIPPEALDRITEAFYMVDKSRSRAEGGAGLGLALCHKIAQVHGGTLTFESTVGKGTTVTVRMEGCQ